MRPFPFFVTAITLLPALIARPTAPFVTIPLKFIGHPEHSTLGPHITHLKHASRAIHRLARHKRVPAPNPDEILARLVPSIRSRTEGYPQSELDAANSGALEKARKPSYKHSIGLDIEANDIGYVGRFFIGTPAKEYRLLVDTGSADTWVGYESCHGDEGGGCGNHTFIGPSTSETFRLTDDLWSIRYGSGASSGKLAYDVFRVGDLTLDSHKFGVATNESSQFTSDVIYCDGLLGLAQSALSQQHVQTPLDALHAANVIPAIASYKISRLSDGKNDGELTLGGMDSSKYRHSTLVVVKNASPDGFWEVSIDSVRMGHSELGLKNRTAILDTGTTLLLAPKGDVDAIHAKIPGSEYNPLTRAWSIPCTGKTDMTLTIGGKRFAIEAGDLLFVPVDMTDRKGRCISGITEGAVGGPQQWLVGDLLLKNVYFSTDSTKNEISLAKLA